MVDKDPNRMLISALKNKPSILNLSNQNLGVIPVAIGKIDSIKSLVLKNNKVVDLPPEFGCLKKLINLNVGNNCLRTIPVILSKIKTLTTLHIFGNQIQSINSEVLCGLKNLTILNLNNNKITKIPPEINRLSYLQYLSLDNNHLKELPTEICHLSELQELDINNNIIECLPKEVAFLQSLIKLRARKNKLKNLPEELSQCTSLTLLDVAGNYIQSFPAEICKMKLKEMYCEENNLLQHVPVRSVQEPEVLTLKESSARMVLTEMNNPSSRMRDKISYHPEVEELLKLSSKCALCEKPFLNTWLECVQFIDSKKTLKTKNNAGVIPVRGLLCSYECFNQVGHEFFGIAKAV